VISQTVSNITDISTLPSRKENYNIISKVKPTIFGKI